MNEYDRDMMRKDKEMTDRLKLFEERLLAREDYANIMDTVNKAIYLAHEIFGEPEKMEKVDIKCIHCGKSTFTLMSPIADKPKDIENVAYKSPEQLENMGYRVKPKGGKIELPNIPTLYDVLEKMDKLISAVEELRNRGRERE